jgi:hypothetical protein
VDTSFDGSHKVFGYEFTASNVLLERRSVQATTDDVTRNVNDEKQDDVNSNVEWRD